MNVCLVTQSASLCFFHAWHKHQYYAQTTLGLSFTGTDGEQAFRMALAWCNISLTSNPIKPDGTMPKLDSAEYRPPMKVYH